ncbi:alpha-(1,3)-fucosyltransferase 10-like isoform X2 [Stegodyphus dumicola]|uniref:alpha-(1,3)-fucosyltransferase 10-like isoform X2 n=1 Tax=Stegodyphus dumicola TaxID=202533 RepID=UPI0015AC60FE|nr:alpha-(1,3)-fucosyltransferase 10-like isoform X2 [Stegodyphus dumicola]
MGLRKIKSFLSKRRSFRSQVAILIVGLDGNEEDAIIYNIVKGIPKDSKEHPILIWWTPFTGENGAYKQCGNDICFFTDEKKYFSDPLTKGFLFYGSDFKPTDLPLPRKPYHDWALLHEESPKNNFLFSVEKVMKLFNHTATFRRESDLPLTLQYLESVESLKSKKFFVPTSVKNAKGKELAPVVYVQSDCNTPSERDSYVEELSKHIPVDSYGKCLHNKELPPELSDAMSGMNSDAFWFTLSQYKFNLAFENAVCRDYITEKLWRPLVIGSVPIYYGSPAVEDWLPNPDSAILTKNFASPKQLAEHLLRLQTDDEAYERYLEHKILGKISNQRLIEALSNREWGINNDHTKRNFIECFECMVCKRVAHNHRRALKGNMPLKYQANLNHYGCPEPVSPFTLKPDSQSWWLELHNKAKYEATALQNLMSRGMNFSSTDFYQEVINLLENSALQEE